MRIAVVGCGYVGLVTGVGLAMRGHEVTGIERLAGRLEQIRAGRSPFYEPALSEGLSGALGRGTFRATGEYSAVADAEVVMICVGTPSAHDGSIDLSMLREAVADVSAVMEKSRHYQVLAIRSTVVPGTAEREVFPILARTAKNRVESIGLVVNPEFLREGRAMEEFLKPDRIVVGESDPRGGDVLQEMYRGFSAPIIRVNLRTAEMIKYATNTFLALLVSFSNELARICEAVPHVDIEDVLGGLRSDRRLCLEVNGAKRLASITHYLKAGCGFGGSCLPKDLKAMIHFARESGVDVSLLEAVSRVNESQPSHFVDLIERFASDLKGRKVLVLGMSFKEGTDDIRDSPGISIATEILKKGAFVTVFDPLVKRKQLGHLRRLGAEFTDDPESFLEDVDLCVITTADPSFGFVDKFLSDPGRAKPLVVDGRRIVSNTRAKNLSGVGLNKRASLAGR